MDLNDDDPTPIPDPENSTVYAAFTPSESVVADLLEDHDTFNITKPNSSVPWPGSIFIISSFLNGGVITLLDGQVVLAPPGGRGSIHWECVENSGWLGFRNPVSGKFLGHDKKGRLCCSAVRHSGWENFCVRMRPDGGYSLLMTHYDRLWPVGIKMEEEVEKLAKIEKPACDGIIWEFVKV